MASAMTHILYESSFYVEATGETSSECPPLIVGPNELAAARLVPRGGLARLVPRSGHYEEVSLLVSPVTPAYELNPSMQL